MGELIGKVLLILLALCIVGVLVRDWLETRRIYRRMDERERAFNDGASEVQPPICADTGAPKWPGNCWNVRCQLGGTCCRNAGVPDGQAPEHCEWREDDPNGLMPGTYASACGELWSFNDAGPNENNVRFCQGCGKPVRALAFVEPTDEDADGVKASDGN